MSKFEKMNTTTHKTDVLHIKETSPYNKRSLVSLNLPIDIKK